MNIAVGRKGEYLKSKKKLRETQDEIDFSTAQLRDFAEKERNVAFAKKFYAASRIQGVVRGYLARLLAADMMDRYRATIMIQKLVRGRLGRLRWLREYWKAMSVVRSDTALKELLERSKQIRVDDFPHYWKEMFDPVTFGFWYYNCKTGQNTWNCPVSLQSNLVCTWEGNQVFGAGPSQKQCRCVFGTMIEYHGHLRTAHKWFCTACDAKNTGMEFPVCGTCGNTLSEDGENAAEVLEKHLDRMTKDLKDFLTKENAAANPEYVIKDRLIEIAMNKRASIELAEKQRQEQERLEEEAQQKKAAKTQFATKIGDVLAEVNDPEGGGYKNKNKLPNIRRQNSRKRSSVKTPGRKTRLASLERTSTTNITPMLSMADVVPLVMQTRLNDMPPEMLPEEDPLFRGVIPPADFHEFISKKKPPPPPPDEDPSVASGDMIFSNKQMVSFGSESVSTEWQQVCRKYLNKLCTKTTCSMAHPGIRDNASVEYMRVVGSRRKVPFVRVCPRGITCDCPNQEACLLYHCYVRPPTAEIIRKLYPIEDGKKVKEYISGAKQTGMALRDQFNGYGIFTWPNGATYMGDWKDDLRHGFGIYRNPDGVEYVGQWLEGKRHGWGVLSHPNGEEYVGEWAAGTMCGIGVLLSRYGDYYEGHFAGGKYEGLGRYYRCNGNKYVGYFRDGCADGLGILTLTSGEKYRGYFSHNARHGCGICKYANGSMYSGQWYRGHHDGVGVYVSPEGEKYVGEWSASKKHGRGRYFFLNGDFYDGEFFKNLAKGVGVYCHMAAGNVYSGQWDNDMRNGRGTYVFSTGARYTGNWVDNNIHGKGKFDYENGCHYRGQYDRNIKHGKGIFSWPNGNTYKGTFVNGIIEGMGEMTYVLGHRYVGNWVNNKKNGYGVFYYNEGHRYEGMWVDDVRHGKGKMTFLPGTFLEEYYDGDWYEGEKHGTGVYCYRQTDGTLYEGTWDHGRRDGKGKLSFKDGSFYRGDFKNELMHGYGVYVGADGSQYEGEWFCNMRHGKGTLLSSDGSIYQGMFWNNKRHGDGNVELLSGNEYRGTWDGGKIDGKGVVTLKVGETPFGGPSKIKVKVFGY